jgi:hypothetical protein
MNDYSKAVSSLLSEIIQNYDKNSYQGNKSLTNRESKNGL